MVVFMAVRGLPTIESSAEHFNRYIKKHFRAHIFSDLALHAANGSCLACAMTLEVSTPALLFPAISLLFLSFTNRFLHLSALIRSLHRDWLAQGDAILRAQIENLRSRLSLIRTMQLFGAMSLFLCVISMLSVIGGYQLPAVGAFLLALALMALSLGCLIYEVWISGGALRILLNELEDDHGPPP